MRSFFLAICALSLCLSAHAQSLSTEQQAWLDQLAQDPTRVTQLMQAERDRARMDHWNSVTQVGVAELVLASGVSNGNPVPIDPVQILQGETLYVWFAIETPRSMVGGVDVKAYWYHESDSEPERMNTLTIEKAAPYWRTYDQWRMKKTGSWTVVIMHGERELDRATFTVR